MPCESISCSIVSDSAIPDYSLPDSSVHGILQSRTLEWVPMPSSRGSSWPRDQTWVSCIVGRFFTVWATRGNPTMPCSLLRQKFCCWPQTSSRCHVPSLRDYILRDPDILALKELGVTGQDGTLGQPAEVSSISCFCSLGNQVHCQTLAFLPNSQVIDYISLLFKYAFLSLSLYEKSHLL